MRDLLRPLDDRDRAVDRLLPAEIGELRWAAQPVEIGVNHGPSRGFINLHQGEGRTRRFELRRLGKGPDEPAGESGFAGSEIAGESDEVVGLEPGRLRRRDGQSRRFVRRLEAPNARFFSYTGETVHALYWTDCVLGGAMSCGLAAVAPIGSTGKMQVTVVPSRGAVSIRTRP